MQTPTIVDPMMQAAWDKDIKEKRVILYAIKDHLILHAAKKSNIRTFDFVVLFFQSDNMSQKMIRKTKLRMQNEPLQQCDQLPYENHTNP